jgi:hypothetical protein
MMLKRSECNEGGASEPTPSRTAKKLRNANNRSS